MDSLCDFLGLVIRKIKIISVILKFTEVRLHIIHCLYNINNI